MIYLIVILCISGQDGKSFDQLMEEKFQKIGKSWKEPLKRPVLKLSSTTLEGDDIDQDNGILSDVVLYVTKKCEAAKAGLQAAILEMGGSLRHHYAPDVTHVIFHSNRKNDPTKEFRQARDDGKHVVAPDWVFMCRDCQEKIDESAFSHTYNPKMALSMSISSSKRAKLNSTVMVSCYGILI